MKILRLDLLAFGPFTEQSLKFDSKTGLHIVHGPNEAGKSSSLRALHALLYGIPSPTPDNFVHSNQNLRIGGFVETAEGAQLEFIRRKGSIKTLRGPDDDKVFDESQLQKSLSGVDKTTFSKRFGIDYEELRRGGESVVCGGGDLSEILFAAGGGVSHLRKTQERLEVEAGDLFKAGGSKPHINDALSKLKEARQAIRDSQLPTSQWIEHDRALRIAEKRQREIDDELTQKRTERSRLDRVSKSLPLIAKLKSLREKLDEVANAKLLPESFPADHREAETNLKNAQVEERKTREEIGRLGGELRHIEVPFELLDHRTAITQLHTDFGSYKKATTDRPGLIVSREGAQREAEKHLQDLGRVMLIDEAESLRMPKVQRKRIQELAGEFKALIQDQQSRERAGRELDDEITRIQEEIGNFPTERDVSDLERTIRQVQKQGNLDAQHQGAKLELESLLEQANVELARLPLFKGTLEELERLPVPTLETINRFENELAETDGEVCRWKDKIDDLTDENQTLQSNLNALHLEGEVPTEVDLEHARKLRDAGWELILNVWRNGYPGDDPSVAAFAAGGDLATAFLASIDKADAVADRLRREADRVAKKAKLTADFQKSELNLEKTRDAWGEAKRNKEQVQREWRSQWEPASIEPASPREMRPWRLQQQSLAKSTADIRIRTADVERLAKQINSLRVDLNTCLDALDQPRVSDKEPLTTPLERCQEIADQIRHDNQQREQLVRDQKKLSGQRPQAEREADDARTALDQWRMGWTEAVAAIGLDGDAKPSEAIAVIETVDEILQLSAEMRKLGQRIDGIDADAEKFRQSVRHLLQQVAPDLLDTSEILIGRAVADLVDRLSQAEKDQTKVDAWQTQLQSHRGALTGIEAKVAQWEGTLEKLCEQAGCQSLKDLPLAEERSKTRRATEIELKSVEERLLELAAGTIFEEWIETAEEFDLDRVQADLARLDQAIVALESETKSVSKSIGEASKVLSQMDGSGKAADALIQSEHLLASIRNDAEEYIRRRLASAVLSKAMDRFREASQGPVLSNASELFSMLTRGSFAGLRPDYNASGRAILVGVRPGGQTIDLSGMSDGTCDQLYLALRIALLEYSLVGREPLPFIVDDILIKFDDQRAVAALKVLARLSEKTQVIFFTHHQHIVDVAGETLKCGTASIHRL